MAARCASASSTAENFFCFKPSRASARVSAVSSVIRPGCRRKTRWRPAPRRGLLRLALAVLRGRQSRSPGVQIPSVTPAAFRHARSPRTTAEEIILLLTGKAHRLTLIPDRFRSPGMVNVHSHHSTTFGTRKKCPRVAGAFLTYRRDPAVGYDVRALLHLHRRDRRHRLDPLDVDLGQLLDEGQDRVELAPQVLDLLLGDRDAGQMRDAADGGGVDGHPNFPADRIYHPRCRYSRGRNLPATAAQIPAFWPAVRSELDGKALRNWI